MNIEQIRAGFEAWCLTLSLDIGRDDNGDYISLETYLSWEAYRAGRAASRCAEPVKRKRPYAQGSALGEFGVIPMCDQYLEEMIGPEHMGQLAKREL